MRDEAGRLPEPEDAYARRDVTLSSDQVNDLNSKFAAILQKQGAVRVQVAYFRCPWPCTRRQYERARDNGLKRWIGYMEKTGWALVSKPRARLDKRRRCYDLLGDWYSLPLMDVVEVPVAAAFKKLDIKLVRTEVPVRD